MADRPQTYIGERERRQAAIFMALLFASLIPILFLNELAVIHITTKYVVVWMVCLATFILADLWAGRIEDGVWSGYLQVALFTAWLSLDIGAAALLLGVGVAVNTAVRIFLPGVSRLIPTTAIEDPITFATHRIVFSEAGLLSAAFIYWLLDGVTPINADNLKVAPLIIALIAGFVVTESVGTLLTGYSKAYFQWRSPTLRRWTFQEGVLLSAIIPLVLVGESQSPLIFMLLMGAIASQILLRHDVSATHSDITERMRELDLLKTAGQNIAADLALKDVLQNIYNWVHDLINPQTFFIALYDQDRHQVDFPLVMKENERVQWTSRDVNTDPLLERVIESKSTLHLEGTNIAFANESSAGVYGHSFLGIPLKVGEKLIGVMAIIADSKGLDFTRLDSSALEVIATQASLAIRNATLYDRSVRLAENLAQINRSVQDVMFNLDSDNAMEAACETAMRITKARKAAIFLLNDDGDAPVKLVMSSGLTEAHRKLYEDKTYLPDIYHFKPRIVSDVRSLTDDDPLRKLAEAGEFSALAEIPLKSGNTLIGMLTLFQDTPYRYHESELELLETLAYQVAAALDNTELLGALELYASEQAQLVHLSRISTTSLDQDKVIDIVGHMLQQMMSVDQVAIGLLTPERSALQIFDSDSNLIRELQLKAIPELEGFSQQIQPGPRVYYREDEVTSEQLLAFMSEFNVTMLAFIPMVVNNDLQGLIVLGNIASRYFTDGEWRLIEMSANQIATQLHNARLYRQTQDDLSRRLQQLALIEDIAQQISSTLNIEQLIQNVLEAAIRATQADVAMLGLVTETDDFRIIGKELLDGEWKQFEGTRAAKIGLMGQAARTGETLIINDNSEWSNYAPTLSSRTYGSSVVVPLIQKDVVIGVLNVESEKKTFFNDERIDFIKSLVGHAVISIQNTRLLQERQNRIETLTLLRDMSLRLSSDTDRESVMEAVLRTALDIFQGAEAVLFGYSGHNDTIELITSMRHDDLRHTDAHVPIPKSVIYRAAHSGGIDVVEDVRASEDFAKFEGMDAVKYVSVLIAPIKHGSRVEEILCVTLNHSLSYLNTDLNAVELLTIQAASHLENAALYKQIRSTNDRMRAILDSTRDGIILLDPKGQLIEANPSAENLLNIDLEDRMNENFAEILLGELQEGHTRNESMYDALTDMARTLRLRPKRITTRSIEIFKEGKTRYVEEVGSPVMDSKQRIMGRLLTLRDVTEERLLDAFRDEITNMVVHDLRGPLSSIISSLAMTLEILQEMTAGETMDTVAPMMEVSMNSAVNLLELVDSILDIAKLESRTMPLKRAPTSVEDLVTSAFAQLATSIQEADIVVEQDIPADLPLVDVDADKVRRVMVNLLDNAVRYTPNGGTVLLSAEKSGNHKVVIRICDSGAGIPSDEANRVFEKFRQIKENVPYHGSKGSGLGLTFCKLALEAHNESIWIEQNGPLSGATFAFTLPVVTPGSSIAPENVPVQAAPLSV